MPSNVLKPSPLVLPLADLTKYRFDPFAPPPSENWIFEGLMEFGDFTIWIGQKKHRKTNLQSQMACCAAAAAPFLWFPFAPSKPLKVAYLDYESKERGLYHRCQQMANNLNFTPEQREQMWANLHIYDIRRAYRNRERVPKFPHREGSIYFDYWRRFVDDTQADLYFIDPMRSFHDGNEQDSMLEDLLNKIRLVFQNRSMVMSHHMRKGESGEERKSLLETSDLRVWSDNARGSTAITAHADVIVCQEREADANDNETITWAAYMKDGYDITPTTLEETASNSFVWKARNTIPTQLNDTLRAVKQGGAGYKSRTDIAKCIVRNSGKSLATAYRHIDDLIKRGLVTRGASGIWLARTIDEKRHDEIRHAKPKYDMWDVEAPIVP